MFTFLGYATLVGIIVWILRRENSSSGQIREDLCRAFISKNPTSTRFVKWDDFPFHKLYIGGTWCSLTPFDSLWMDCVHGDHDMGDFTYRELWWIVSQVKKEKAYQRNVRRQTLMSELNQIVNRNNSSSKKQVGDK